MRVTPENLIRIARETAQKQAYSDPGLVAAYLVGSVRAGDPLLGGAGDIDIVFVHTGVPPVRREIIPLTPEIHLDIVHNPRSEYDRPKALRIHPWLGPELYDPLPLHGTQHFFEFVQAGVRDKYNDPENVLSRAQTLAMDARGRWNHLQLSAAEGPDWILEYLACLFNAANSIALLTGDPLSERRLLLGFPACAEKVGFPGLVTDLYQLCGVGRFDSHALLGILPEWESALVAAGTLPVVDKRITTPRLRYYRSAFESLLAGETPQSILWPLLLTWTLAISVLPGTWVGRWQVFCEHLGLAGSAMDERMDGLDHFLDSIEETLERRSIDRNM